MSRIRSIKPEFWTSEQVLECSTNARLLFIGLWNFCDDAGRHPYSAKQAKAEVFPADDFTEKQLADMLSELETHELIVRYSAGNKEYFYVSGWKHQRIDKPQEPKYPDPFDENSKIIQGTFPPDRIGRDRKGKEEDAPLALIENDDEKELFRRGRDVLGAGSGGLVKRLVLVKGGNIALARAAIETASTKGDPREYVGAMLKGIGKSGRSRMDETCPPEIYDLLVK